MCIRDSLLDMTRIEAGVLKINRTSTTVQDLIDEALSAMGSSLKNRRVNVCIDDSLSEVSIDRLLMVQVLVNLLDNALRHSPREGVITIRSKMKDDRVVVSVADEGAGVPLEDRDTIFNRFVKFDTGGRAGLGLTIACLLYTSRCV